MTQFDRESITTTASVPGESPIERAFRLLQIVVGVGESVGVRELSRRSGLPRSTVSRLVGILTQLGMVDRTADGSIIPGSALATLQREGGGTPTLVDQLRPLLAELVQTVGENAAISVDDGDQLLYVAQVTAGNPVSVPAVNGERHAFHLVAPGLLTMAWWPDARLETFLAPELAATTEYSVTDSDQIRNRVNKIRSDCYCWTNQELDEGVNGLGVPVLDEDDHLVASISLFGPSYRFSPEARPNLADQVLKLTANRSRSLLT